MLLLVTKQNHEVKISMSMKQLVLSRNAYLRSHLQYAASLIHVGITTHHASHVAVAGTVSVSPLSDALSLSLALSPCLCFSVRVCVCTYQWWVD